MGSPLSSDIIDYVFTSLPDFATLFSTILVSKSFHEIFQTHPSSILTSVAETQIGSDLLPCAIRLAHFNRDEYLASRANYVQDFPAERKFSHREAPAVTPYIAALVRNDSIVTELELFFSTTCVLLSVHSREYADGCPMNRCKDRESGTRSLLNPRESLRFRRAFYRWWLMINLFPARYLRPAQIAGGKAGDEESNTNNRDDDYADDEDDDDTDDDGDDDDTDDDTDTDDDADTDGPNVYIEKSWGPRKKFLREFSVDEVAEMWQVHNFMVFASWCAINATPDYMMHNRESLALVDFMHCPMDA